MNFLIDAQLPPALARLITSVGHNAVHVEEAKLLLATDEAIMGLCPKASALYHHERRRL